MDLLLEFQGGLYSCQRGSPVVTLGLGNVLKDDPSASHVLVLDEFEGVSSLLLRGLLEPLGESGQGNVVAIKVGCLKKDKSFYIPIS